MKKFLVSYFVWILFVLPAYCLYADDSIDTNIKKTYNTDKVEKDLLPNLPKVQPISIIDNATQPTVFTPPNNQSRTISKSYNKEYKEIKINKGTKFKTKCYNTLADNAARGTRVSFVTVYPETSRYITIPAGTVIKGQITDSHGPQFTGNGGLVQVKINELTYKNSTYYIEGNIVNANYKKVFLNDIKGKHTYMKNMGKIIQPGKRFLGKTWKICGNLSNGPEILLTPFALGSGLIVFGANVMVSPALAIFSTGKSISFPSGTYYEIKLTQDALIKDY